MKRRIHITPIEKINSEYRNINSNSNLTKESKISKKEEQNKNILLSHKSSLDLLFTTIKNFINNYFTKENAFNKIKLSKELLTLLKYNLIIMNQEKMKQLNLLEIDNENKKKNIKEMLFTKSSYIKQRDELKNIIFQIENEIKKTKILIEIKNKILLSAKYISFYLDINREIFYNINQENTEIISELLKDIRKAIKKEFFSIIKEKMETDLEIDSLEFKINTIKENIINKIYEDTKGSNKTLKLLIKMK